MKRFRASLLALAVAAAAAIPLVTATSASAHGWVTDPPSRQDYCARGATSFDCGSIKYEPQSVEAPKGSMQCSGGNAAFRVLDDSSKPWPRKTVSSNLNITWNITARHATSKWEYFVDGQLFKTINDNGKQPPASLTHSLSGLPSGNHTILARWNVADTAMAFYSCMDVNVNGTGTPTTPPTTPPTSQPTTPPTNPGTCTGAAWSKSSVYNGGATVTHNGHSWKAKWWTTGEEPGKTGQWGVWSDLGAC